MCRSASLETACHSHCAATPDRVNCAGCSCILYNPSLSALPSSRLVQFSSFSAFDGLFNTPHSAQHADVCKLLRVCNLCGRFPSMRTMCAWCVCGGGRLCDWSHVRVCARAPGCVLG